jgi:hypothetical protein
VVLSQTPRPASVKIPFHSQAPKAVVGRIPLGASADLLRGESLDMGILLDLLARGPRIDMVNKSATGDGDRDLASDVEGGG